ncbi:hypothetical protein AcV5_009935 [Taiwanofungus camphoratus]|nr:hypothetical protein AcV7_007197 [Antrodia cinnamomea]KAI0923121.1 hypothetical protein AcV5_009935 [Antrodia cinnamomea]
MTSVTITAIAAASTTVPVTSTRPPIVEILRVLSTFASFVVSSVTAFSLAFARALAAPLTALYHLLQYVLAPVTLFCHIVIDTFVRTPYSLLVSILQNLYPIYVFIGVTCITAAFVGLGARIVAQTIQHALCPVSPRGSADTESALSKARRRVSIKEDRI